LAFPTQQNAPVPTAPVNNNVQNVLNPEVHQTPAGVVEVFFANFFIFFLNFSVNNCLPRNKKKLKGSQLNLLTRKWIVKTLRLLGMEIWEWFVYFSSFFILLILPTTTHQ